MVYEIMQKTGDKEFLPKITVPLVIEYLLSVFT